MALQRDADLVRARVQQGRHALAESARDVFFPLHEVINSLGFLRDVVEEARVVVAAEAEGVEDAARRELHLLERRQRVICREALVRQAVREEHEGRDTAVALSSPRKDLRAGVKRLRDVGGTGSVEAVDESKNGRFVGGRAREELGQDRHLVVEDDQREGVDGLQLRQQVLDRRLNKGQLRIDAH